MKFIKLTIHNIASIKDAVIDFTTDPISSARLFLINGPTGSGKSTILDAICLALFNNVPRFSDCGNRSITNDADGKIRLGDPRGIVRKGATNAFVELEFEGNDSGLYRARWEGVFSQKNTKNRPRGTLIDYEHTLISENGDILSLKSKASDNILSSPGYVGMNFDQFNRTTLLAQGEFDKFLSAEPDKKCSILENLAGVKRFGEYGRRIHDRCTEIQSNLNRLTDKLGGIKLLTAEELEAKRIELSKLSAESKAKGELIETLRKVKTWFDTEKTLNEAVSRHQTEAKTAQKALQSEDFIAAENLVARWQRLRPLVELNQKTNDALKRRDAINQETKSLEQELEMLARSYRKIAQHLADSRHVRIACQQSLSAFDKSKNIIENASLIVSRIDDISRIRSEVSRLEKELKRLDKQRCDAYKTYETRNTERNDAESTFTLYQKQLDDISKRLEAHINSPEGARHRAHTEEQKKLAKFLDSSKIYIERLRAYNVEIDKIDTDKAELDSLTAEAQRLHREYLTALANFEVARAAYDAVMTTTDALVKALRHGLKPGCNCPVCNRLVDDVVSDDVFDAQLDPARKKRDEAEKSMNDWQGLFNKADAELNFLKKKIEKAKKACEKEANTLSEIEKQVIMEGAALGLIADSGRDIVEMADARNRELNDKIERMTDFWTVAQNLTAENTQKSNQVNAARDALTHATKLFDRSKAVCDQIVVEVESKNSELKSKNASIDVFVAEIKEIVPDVDVSALDKIKTEVNEIVRDYQKALSEFDNIELVVSKLEKTVGNISETLGNIDNVELTDGPIYTEDEIFGYVGAYKTQLGVCNANKKAIDDEIDSLTKQRGELLDSLIDMSAHDIENPDLDCTKAEILRISEANELTRKLAADAETALNAVVAQVNEHISKRPVSELDAEGTVAALGQQTDAKTDIDRRLGAVDTELKTDNDNRERHADVLEQIEKVRTISDAWTELDKYFGNDRFKRIVCSYILAELVDRSNFYMTKFRPRYTLIVNPGSLEILVHDRDMGVKRPINTLSGGETFMTSLSLALGLASMSDVGFAADTIFIDEGFGTLSGDCLETVMDSLDRLNNLANRRVGIISHVESLRDRIPTRIDLKPNGTYSTVEVLGS